jgi:hypothetical protein
VWDSGIRLPSLLSHTVRLNLQICSFMWSRTEGVSIRLPDIVATCEGRSLDVTLPPTWRQLFLPTRLLYETALRPVLVLSGEHFVGCCHVASVPVRNLSSRPGWGTPEVAYELGVSALSLVQVFVFKRCIISTFHLWSSFPFFVLSLCPKPVTVIILLARRWP